MTCNGTFMKLILFHVLHSHAFAINQTPMNAQMPVEAALKYVLTPLEVTNALVALGTSLRQITEPAMVSAEQDIRNCNTVTF